jgi:TolA-binding protein
VTDTDYDTEERQARALIKSGDVDGAIHVLQMARDTARGSADQRAASDFSGWIGSLFLQQGRAEDALEAFEAAERDEPDNPYHQLTSSCSA